MKLKKIAAVLLLTLSFSTLSFADCIRGGSTLFPTGYLIPHSNIYSRYFECDENGWWVERECPAMLWFNPVTWVCDFPWNVPNPGQEF